VLIAKKMIIVMTVVMKYKEWGEKVIVLNVINLAMPKIVANTIGLISKYLIRRKGKW